jgi:excisionase family DNA binding protein
MDEVCDLYGVSERTILRWIGQREMPSLKIGGKRFFIPDELLVWEKRFAGIGDPDIEIKYPMAEGSGTSYFYTDTAIGHRRAPVQEGALK